MSPLTIELRPRAQGDRIVVQVFVGYSANRTLAGTLNLRVGEFQLFGVTLSMGAKQTHGMVEFEIDAEAERLALDEADA